MDELNFFKCAVRSLNKSLFWAPVLIRCEAYIKVSATESQKMLQYYIKIIFTIMLIIITYAISVLYVQRGLKHLRKRKNPIINLGLINYAYEV